MKHLLRLSLALLLAVGVTGCSGQKYAPVTGVVTYHGAPVAGATVVFTPTTPAEGVAAATAITEADGSYRLQTNLPGGVTHTGAAPGTYKVTVSKFVPPAGMTEAEYAKKAEAEPAANKPTSTEPVVPPKVELIPKEYSETAATKVEATVANGSNEVKIAIP